MAVLPLTTVLLQDHLPVRWSSKSRQNRAYSFHCHESQPQPATRRRYDAAFRAEARRLARESRLTQAAARALNINAKLLYKWQKQALTPVAAAQGPALDPATAAELRQLRATNRRQAQELDILKKALASKRFRRVISVTDNT